jgi:hypothetical protein
LRHPEAVEVRLVADDEVAHGELPRERGDVGGELAPLLVALRRGAAAGVVDGEEEADVELLGRVRDVAQDVELGRLRLRQARRPDRGDSESAETRVADGLHTRPRGVGLGQPRRVLDDSHEEVALGVAFAACERERGGCDDDGAAHWPWRLAWRR